MNLQNLSATVLAATAAVATAMGAAPAQAQIYGSGNGWRQPIQSGPVVRPTQFGTSYRQTNPVMQQPNFGQPQRVSNPGGFGFNRGNSFGW